MAAKSICNANIVGEIPLLSPAEAKSELPLGAGARDHVLQSRQVIENILDRKDKRIFLIVGPCSIHDVRAGEEYAQKLRALSEEVGDIFFLIMRTYFAKPRTTLGWKGLINDPFLDNSCRMDRGLLTARKFLLALAEAGVPVATEALDPIIPQYLDDLISWHAIGARTTESQMHRELASGLSTPVGFKNATDGDIQVAINALRSVSREHSFIGMNSAGKVVIMQTRGNGYCHIVLRGGDRPNYDSVSIAICERGLRDAGLPLNIVVDCSHGNSWKDHRIQPVVLDDCARQIAEGNGSIVGFMMESNLSEGNQPLLEDLSKLRYGVSITDSCLGWEATEEAVKKAYERLRSIGVREFPQ